MNGKQTCNSIHIIWAWAIKISVAKNIMKKMDNVGSENEQSPWKQPQQQQQSWPRPKKEHDFANGNEIREIETDGSIVFLHSQMFHMISVNELIIVLLPWSLIMAMITYRSINSKNYVLFSLWHIHLGYTKKYKLPSAISMLVNFHKGNF